MTRPAEHTKLDSLFDWSEMPVEASKVDIEFRAVLQLGVDLLDVDEWRHLTGKQREFLERAKALGITATGMVWRCDVCGFNTASEAEIREHDDQAHT